MKLVHPVPAEPPVSPSSTFQPVHGGAAESVVTRAFGDGKVMPDRPPGWSPAGQLTHMICLSGLAPLPSSGARLAGTSSPQAAGPPRATIMVQ